MAAWAKLTDADLDGEIFVNLDNVTTLLWDADDKRTTITFVGEDQGGVEGQLDVLQQPEEIIRAVGNMSPRANGTTTQLPPT